MLAICCTTRRKCGALSPGQKKGNTYIYSRVLGANKLSSLNKVNNPKHELSTNTSKEVSETFFLA